MYTEPQKKRCNSNNFIRYGNREYVYSAVVYQKYLTRLRELIIFEPWRENYHSLNRDIFDIRQHYVRILFIFQCLIC